MTMAPKMRRKEDKMLGMAIGGVAGMQKTIIDLRAEVEALQSRLAIAEANARTPGTVEKCEDSQCAHIHTYEPTYQCSWTDCPILMGIRTSGGDKYG